MSHPVVHWEIGGTDPDALSGFYEKLFGWSMADVDRSYTSPGSQGRRQVVVRFPGLRWPSPPTMLRDVRSY